MPGIVKGKPKRVSREGITAHQRTPLIERMGELAQSVKPTANRPCLVISFGKFVRCRKKGQSIVAAPFSRHEVGIGVFNRRRGIIHGLLPGLNSGIN